jgi:hypothetical protein
LQGLVVCADLAVLHRDNGRMSSPDGQRDSPLLMNAAADGYRAAAGASLRLVLKRARDELRRQWTTEQPGHTHPAAELVHGVRREFRSGIDKIGRPERILRGADSADSGAATALMRSSTGDAHE